jgi:uncharacterized protein
MKTQFHILKRRISAYTTVCALLASATIFVQADDQPAGKPYREAETLYTNTNDGTVLAGTLTLPEGKGPFPAVLLITGMGPQDRDETIGPLKPFAVLADSLARRGLAVLRVDDRGTGKSSGNWLEVDYVTAGKDIQCGLDYLKSRPEIDARHMGLLGHSEGGGVGAMAAARSSDVSFLVMLASVCVPQEEYILWTNEGMLRKSNVTGEKLEKDLAGVKNLITAIRDNSDPVQRKSKLMDIVRLKKQSEEETKSEVDVLSSRWAKDYMSGDVTPSLRALKCPVLAMWGDKDGLVGAEPNAAGLRKTLKTGDEKRVSIRVMPSMNHLFQRCVTGDTEEFFKIKETIDPEALQVIGDWLVSQNH